jgi:hypothetical protein
VVHLAAISREVDESVEKLSFDDHAEDNKAIVCFRKALHHCGGHKKQYGDPAGVNVELQPQRRRPEYPASTHNEKKRAEKRKKGKDKTTQSSETDNGIVADMESSLLLALNLPVEAPISKIPVTTTVIDQMEESVMAWLNLTPE